MILITGGLGYVGSTLVNHLIHYTDYKVRVLDLNVYQTASNCFHLLEAHNDRYELVIDDLRTCDLNKLLIDVDYVVHLAALVGEPVCKLNADYTKGINYDATLRLAQKSEELGIKRFIFASTCSNYGITDSDELIDEDGDLNSLSLYSELKIMAEKKLLNDYPCLPVTICRFATAYGVSSRFRFDLMIHEFVRDALEKGEIVLYGAESWRPFIHVVDMARAIESIIKNDTIHKTVYNVGSNDSNITKKALAYQIRDLLNTSSPDSCKVTCIDSSCKKDPRDYKVNFNKIHKTLGFNTHYNISDTLPVIVSLWKNNFVHPSLVSTNVNNQNLDLTIKRFVNPKTYKLNGCFVDDDNQFCLINIHKNASMSIRNVMKMRGKYYPYNPAKHGQLIKICLFRDPVRRLVSAYLYLLRLEDHGYLDEHPTHLTLQTEFYILRDKPIESFNSFLKAIDGGNFFDAVLYPQREFLKDHGLQLDDLDVVMTVENIDSQYERFAAKYHLRTTKFPHDNTSDNSVTELLLNYINTTPDTHKKIYDLYKEDFDLYERVQEKIYV